MITSRLNGGLGNQLFQIATAYSLALDNNDECAFYLGHPVVHQGNMALTYKDNVLSGINELPVTWTPQNGFREKKDNVYQPIPYKNDLILSGYFQCEKYFAHHKNFIIDLLTHQPTIEEVSDIFSTVLNNSVSIHVRRGDYLKFGVCMDKRYYYKALGLLCQRTKVENVLVFSDDIGWCKENLFDKDDGVYFIEFGKDYEDFYLMSLCTNNIVGNSSFSWWASYINRNPEKMVYMPKPFSKSHADDIYYKNVIPVDI